jgi:hypothetical protein
MLHKGHGVVLLQQRLVEFSSSIRKTHADRSFIDKKHLLGQAISAILKLQAAVQILVH